MDVAPVGALLEERQATLTSVVTLSSYTYDSTGSYEYFPVSTSIRRILVYPLTTIFTPPSSCFAPTYTLAPTDGPGTSGSASGYDVWYTQYTEIDKEFSSECYPPYFKGPSWSASILTDSTTNTGPSLYYYKYSAPISFYSPGLCPSGWASHAGSVSASVTFTTCCPDVPSGLTASPGYCYGYRPEYPVTILNGTQTTSVTLNYFYVSSIQVGNEASDYAILSAATATTTSSSSSTISASPSPTVGSVTPTSTTSSDSTSSGLSTGAQAGIGVGVSVAGLLLLGAALLFFLKRRRETPKTGAAPSTFTSPELQQVEKMSPQMTRNSARYEVQST